MAEQFPPLSAATLAAANQSALAGAGRSGDAARAAAGGRGSAGRQRRDPNHRRRLPSGGGAGGPAADQRRRGTFYGLSLRGGAPGSPLPYVAGGWRPEAHVLADIAHDYWHIPIRGWWWRTSQPTAVRTPVLPGPRWRAGARPSSRDRHSGPDYAAANHGYLRPRLAGATTPPQWLSFPGCSPVLEQTDGQLGFAGGGRGSGRSPATWGCCWASCRACRIPLKGTVRGEKTSSAMSPSRRRSSTPGDSCGRTPSLPGRCRPAPSAEKCPFTADSSQTGNLCY